MKITIDLCKQTSKQLEQYLSQRNIQRANLADEFEKGGDNLIAADLRNPISAEEFVLMTVLKALDEGS